MKITDKLVKQIIKEETLRLVKKKKLISEKKEILKQLKRLDEGDGNDFTYSELENIAKQAKDYLEKSRPIRNPGKDSFATPEAENDYYNSQNNGPNRVYDISNDVKGYKYGAYVYEAWNLLHNLMGGDSDEMPDHEKISSLNKLLKKAKLIYLEW